MQKFHHPYHLYLDEAVYFVTARTYHSKCYIELDNKKQLLFDQIQQVFSDHAYQLFAWIILDNHYHLLFKSNRGSDLPKIMQHIHGGCSFKMNALDGVRGRKIFQNYWDTGIRNRRSFYIHFNYIHHNPVKHGYVSDMRDYQFSSYHDWCKKKGEDWILSCFETYPILDFLCRGDV